MFPVSGPRGKSCHDCVIFLSPPRLSLRLGSTGAWLCLLPWPPGTALAGCKYLCMNRQPSTMLESLSGVSRSSRVSKTTLTLLRYPGKPSLTHWLLRGRRCGDVFFQVIQSEKCSITFPPPRVTIMSTGKREWPDSKFQVCSL